MGEILPVGCGTIAERLDWLIRTKHPDGRGPSGYDEIAKASREYAAAHGGPTISHQTVLNIRNGRSTNPGVDSLRALANVYGVKVTFFLETSPAAEGATPASDAPPATPQAGDGPQPSTGSLAARLNSLFAAAQPKGSAPLTNEAVAEAVTARGAEITAEDIRALRAGEWDNPTRRHLQCLADHFGVPSAYFFDDTVAARVADDLALLNALKEVGAREVALRAVAELSDEALNALVPVIEQLGKSGRRQRM